MVVSNDDHTLNFCFLGKLEYELNVDPTVIIGQQLEFELRPKNPGLVYATVKSCDVIYNNQAMAIFGYNSQSKCENFWLGAKWITDYASSQESGRN